MLIIGQPNLYSLVTEIIDIGIAQLFLGLVVRFADHVQPADIAVAHDFFVTKDVWTRGFEHRMNPVSQVITHERYP
jgi:hypothetical protein